MQTLYGEIDSQLFSMFKDIKLLVCDVDGVFSDGQIYMGNAGEELKAFNTKDGYGIKAIQKLGITVAIITGRQSNIVEQRMTALGVEHIIQGEEDKETAIVKIMKHLQINNGQVASMGDDMPDLGMFRHSAIAICPNDGHPHVKKYSQYVTTLGGGKGAVREVCDIILQAHQQESKILSASV